MSPTCRLVAASVLLIGCHGSGKPQRAAMMVVGGIDGRLDARLMKNVKEALTPMGFSIEVLPEAIESGDAEVVRGHAARVDAAHAIVFELKAAQERPGLLDGTFLWSVEATARVVNEDTSLPLGEAYTMEFVGEGTSAATIESNVLDTWEQAFIPHVADALIFSPQVDQLFQGNGNTDELLAAVDIQKYVDFAQIRREAKLEYEQYCRAEQERLDAFSESEGVSCYGDPCGQSVLVGVNAAGRPIAQNVTRRPILTAPPKRKGLWAELPEEVVVYGTDGTPSVLLRSANFYGIGQARYPDYGTVDLFTSEGTSAVYGYDSKDGARKKLVLLDKGQRNRISEVSPDGDMLLGCISRGSCYLEADGVRRDLPGIDAAKWVRLDQGQLLLAHGGDSEQVWFADPKTPDAKPKVIPLPAYLRSVAGSSGNSVFIVTGSSSEGCSYVELDATQHRIASTVAMPFCPDWPRRMTDGRVVATAELNQPDDVGGDVEVVVWDPELNTPFPLTRGTFQEEFPTPALDNSRVFFNRRMPVPDDSRFRTNDYRRVVCEVEVPER